MLPSRYLPAALLALPLFSTPISSAQVARTLASSPAAEQGTPEAEALLRRRYELSQRPALASRGSRTVYRGAKLTAIQFPVGGIGTGCIQFDGRAVPRFWQTFNNMTHDFVPNSFLAVRVKDGRRTRVRALQTTNVGPFQGMRRLEADSSFPFLRYRYTDLLPAEISLEVFNPFIPTDLKNSSIPAVFYRFKLENHSDKKLEISLLASQQNAVGFSKVPKIFEGDSFAERYRLSLKRELVTDNRSNLYGQNVNRIDTAGGNTTLYMEGPFDPADEHFGQMALMLLGDGEHTRAAQGTASWTDPNQLLRKFRTTGQLAPSASTEPSPPETTWTGAINLPLKLPPRSSRTIHMVLAWYFPNGKNGGHLDRWDSWGKGKWQGKGNYYANHWGSIQDLVAYIARNHATLVASTERFRDSFYATNLPYWLVERLGNQLATLKSRTIFHDKGNYVGLWEGVGAGDGSCAGNCNHVWHYPQAHARLFPSLARRIKEQSFLAIKRDGQIPYRQPAGKFAFDGQCGDILGAYREHLMAPDASWLRKQYPAIKKAMNYVVRAYDSDRDGWLSDAPKHTTYDASMSGNPSFLSSLYLAALLASERMAISAGDMPQARKWKKIAQKSARVQNERLWNGEYFIQVPGKMRHTDYENGCHSDQLLGQWWADQVGLGSMYPDYRVRSAIQAVAKYNFKSTLRGHVQLVRRFAKPAEAGMVVTTWPGNDRTPYASGYSDEVWPTFEYTVGASLFKYGDIGDALTILRSGFDRYDGTLKFGYKTKSGWGNFGFSGNPFGDDECGQFYARSLSIWSVLLAAQGFQYAGPELRIGFDPKWRPDDHISFFTVAEGWGTFRQRRGGGKQVNTLVLEHGKLRLSKLVLHTDSARELSAQLSIKGRETPAKLRARGTRYEVSFRKTELRAGDELTVVLR